MKKQLNLQFFQVLFLHLLCVFDENGLYFCEQPKVIHMDCSDPCSPSGLGAPQDTSP